jgi:hypothetical protein
MDAHTVLLFLKAGFAGLALLLAWLAFKLIANEQAREKGARVGILRLVRVFAVFATLLALFAVIAIPLEGYVESARQERVRSGKQARNCRDGLSRLSNAATAVLDEQQLKTQVHTTHALCEPILTEFAGDGR